MMQIPLIISAIEDDADRIFMENIYIELYPLMKVTAYKIVKSNSIAEDMVHDAIAMLIGKLNTIHEYERKRLTSYIVNTVKNISINYYNRHIKDGGRVYYGDDEDFGETMSDGSYLLSESFEIREKYEALGNAIKQLSEKDRHILHLKYNLELDNQAIAKAIGIKPDSVREYLTRARREARKHLSKEGDLYD